MRQVIVAFILTTLSSTVFGQSNTWVAQSNAFTQRLLDVEFKHSPEFGSRQGVSKFDTLISDPSLADELAQRKELAAILADLKPQAAREANKHVAEDLAILQKAFDLRFRQEDYDNRHLVPFINASQDVFQGLRELLDDQIAPERRPAALARLQERFKRSF